jgi:ribosomal protein L34
MMYRESFKGNSRNRGKAEFTVGFTLAGMQTERGTAVIVDRRRIDGSGRSPTFRETLPFGAATV